MTLKTAPTRFPCRKMLFRVIDSSLDNRRQPVDETAEHNRRNLLWVMLAAVVVLTGCTAASKPTNYYLMSPAAPIATPIATPARINLAVGVGPMRLADHLQRQNIVIRESSTRLHIAPDDRWAAPLDAHLLELLATNLRQRLDLAGVPTFPWSPAVHVDYQVTVHITRFIHDADHVYLDAHWRLFRVKNRSPRGSTPPAEHLTSLEAPSERDYDRIVDTMGQLVGGLSDEIAEAIRQLDR
ncbi:MAG: hypothetical protein BECKG1743D_GA0114223_103973 [Candidatus Kentron sp. G]|nr:MAG: hypothetical protein BECKG1743F_GA0114225_102603 [Candidatus Kentron sp. G]VFN02780.1 MAG: hypothetical protein BECKG1743D_GA0114223_103973 [Candidatus Kentron sp. G]VFN05022.1 MAG: hypothetical protein BECKG1743E_GA0114224_108112 [Candidatus Kentron sp. G]